ncbi:MAG: threonine synthase [Desulfobacter sp.]|nr:MAG: threonine synthase [Desulfobacter sp.]
MTIKYISTLGRSQPVEFDEAILSGFARDKGLFVPDTLPWFSRKQLSQMAELSYTDLAHMILSRFIPEKIIPPKTLKRIVKESFAQFTPREVLPLVPSSLDPSILIMELFHGPSLSFKDIAMGFLIRVMDYFLQQKKEHLNLILATTGDTGPAAAHASAGKKTIDCWPLFPMGMITDEQERQMTCLDAPNVYPVGVDNCPDGGDDLDRVVENLFSHKAIKQELNLSSVNSINWCRIMVQSIHYFYGYFRACDAIGDPIVFSVPSGAFGNLFAGYLAKAMGLPVTKFICSVNANKTLYQAFSTGIFQKNHRVSTLSSAIDIVLPYNFWRFLYFATGRDSKKIQMWMEQLEKTGKVVLDPDTRRSMGKDFCAISIDDEKTLEIMGRCLGGPSPCLVDPHTAVGIAGALLMKPEFSTATKIICLSTAHPGKFPEATAKAMAMIKAQGKPCPKLPETATHPFLTQNQ